MNKVEISKSLKNLFKCDSVQMARDINSRLKKFISENILTSEDLREFTRSGAGEMLAMMIA